MINIFNIEEANNYFYYHGVDINLQLNKYIGVGMEYYEIRK